MKSIDCTVKTRVGHISYGSMFRGTVLTPVTQRPDGVEMVVVEWDNGNVQKMQVKLLMPEEDLVKEEARLKAEKLRLDEEFAILAAQVKTKADAAAALINEAQAIAKTINKEARHMGNACDLLQDALDDSGWYQSSVNC